MNAPTLASADIAIPAEFKSCFRAQRAAYLKAPEPTHAERLADLRTLGRLLKDNQAAIVAAINADYGNRSAFETLFGEVFRRPRRHSRRREAPEELDEAAPAARRPPDLPRRAQSASSRSRSGSSASSCRGTFRFMLSLSPLVSIFAAGNRAMVKMSENSQRLAELLIEIVAQVSAAGQARVLCRRRRPRPGLLIAAVRPPHLHRLRRDRDGR